MRFSFAIDIDVPREAVFAFLGDPRNRPRWQSTLSSIDLETEGPPRVGMRWREQPRGGPAFQMEICEYEPPERWAERFASRHAEGTVALAFEEREAATRLQVDVDVRLLGWLRPLSPLVGLVLRGAMRRDLAGVAELLRQPTIHR